MGLIDDCESLFGSKNLYDVLAIEENASLAEIKKAYRKASLLIHPDRAAAGDQVLATRKFQVLGKVHMILSNTEKRALYDETGMINEDHGISEDDESPEFWDKYWRNLFPKISTKDVDNFFIKYKGSEEEMNDMKKMYIKYEGDMNKISSYFIGYNVDEEDELRSILTDMINKDEIPSFPNFVNESKTKRAARIKRLKSEVKEAAEAKKGIEMDLLTAITQRSQERKSQFNSMIQNLEAKYGQKETKGKKKK